jgi:hypothetical protein
MDTTDDMKEGKLVLIINGTAKFILNKISFISLMN